jgi:glycosyltransferase involved in cell wall biosynthesis
MRILMLNNKYLQRGGEEVVFETEVEMLRSNGCEVDTLIEDNEKVQALGGLRTAARAIWSRESYRQVRAKLRSKPYDVMHVHNFFPLFSPSVYYAARAEGVPVVQTLHQYRLMCPVGTFFRDGKVCEDCANKFFPWPAVRHKCYRGSAAASAAVGGMLTGHRLAGTWRDLVTYYIALSEFGRRKFVEAGLPEEKVVIKPNFLPRAAKAGEGKGGYAVFVGRICEEKGVDTLLAAWRRIGNRLPLKIVGEGPYFDAAAEQVRDMDGVELLGWQDSEAVYRLIGDAECIVVPSRWYEGQPVVVIEALGMGTPLIISRIGPMKEFVEDKVSGLLFDPGNADDLASKIEWMIDNRDRHAAMRNAARSEFEARFSAERNFELMMDVYRAAKLSVQPVSAGGDGVPVAGGVNRVES